MSSLPEPDVSSRVGAVLARHPPERGELIPILQEVQDMLGHVPPPALNMVASFLNMPQSSVYGVVTFYSQFRTSRSGRHTIRVCEGTACHVLGSAQLLRTIRRKLGIHPGETTRDLRFTLERVACIGSCALAPAMVVNGTVYGNVTPERALEILEQLP
jgi:NADH-quinone oxidoreductase subunit E